MCTSSAAAQHERPTPVFAEIYQGLVDAHCLELEISGSHGAALSSLRNTKTLRRWAAESSRG